MDKAIEKLKQKYDAEITPDHNPAGREEAAAGRKVETGEAPAETGAEQPATEKLPAVLYEVGRILREYPVRINIETCMPRLIYTDEVRDDRLKEKLYNLVCFNNTVLDYLYGRVPLEIDGDNFFFLGDEPGSPDY